MGGDEDTAVVPMVQTNGGTVVGTHPSYMSKTCQSIKITIPLIAKREMKRT